MPDFYSQLVGCEPVLLYHAPRGGEINGMNPRDKSRLLSRPKGRGMNPKGFNP
jgi:hypothetical protein